MRVMCVGQYSHEVRASFCKLKDPKFDSQVHHFGVIIVSLNKKLYSQLHVLMGTW